MKRKFFPMDLQLFAGEGEDGQSGEAAGGTQTGQTGGQQASAAFDYDKLAGIERKINPRRMQREINSQLENKGIGTKAQQALKVQHEQNKIERKKQS